MKVFLGLGSNIGDREANLRAAIAHLSECGIMTGISKIYETDPVGFLDQGKFLNAAVILETEQSAQEILKTIQSIEKTLKRTRNIPNGPRTIDVDILFYEDLTLETDDLIIPHPRAHERKFVMEPLCDLDEDFIHPVLKKPFKEILEGLE